MARLVSKFNVLLKSSVNSVLKDPLARGPRDAGHKPDPAAHREVARLRDQINAALDHEDRITADIAKMENEIAEWDRQADAALQAGDDSTARQLVRQIQRAQQQRAMLGADLDQHRRSTSDLIRRVNELEAVLAEVQQQHQQVAATPPAEDASATNNTGDTNNDTISLSERLRQARNHSAAPTQPVAPSTQADTPVTINDQEIEDDLARRRNRLSL